MQTLSLSFSLSVALSNPHLLILSFTNPSLSPSAELTQSCGLVSWSQCSLVVEIPPYRNQRISSPVQVNFYVCNGKRKRSQYQRFTYLSPNGNHVSSDPFSFTHLHVLSPNSNPVSSTHLHVLSPNSNPVSSELLRTFLSSPPPYVLSPNSNPVSSIHLHVLSP